LVEGPLCVCFASCCASSSSWPFSDACGAPASGAVQRVLLPPTLNLVPHHNIGLFEFSVENAKGTLHQFATRRFEEYVLAAQTGIEMREFTLAGFEPGSSRRRTTRTAAP